MEPQIKVSRSVHMLTTPRGGYSHNRAVRVCAARKRPISPPDRLLKTPRFRLGSLRKTPLFKNIHLFVPFSDWAAPKDPPFKNIHFSVIFSSKIPVFISEGPLWKPPIFSEGLLPKPPTFKLCFCTHIPLSYMSNPPGANHCATAAPTI